MPRPHRERLAGAERVECPKLWEDSKELSPETSPQRQHIVIPALPRGKGKTMEAVETGDCQGLRMARRVVARCGTAMADTRHHAFSKPVEYTAQERGLL